MIGKNDALFRYESLFFVALGHHYITKSEKAFYFFNYTLVEIKLLAEIFSAGFFCQVVGCWSETACENNSVASLKSILKSLEKSLSVVAHSGVMSHTDTY